MEEKKIIVDSDIDTTGNKKPYSAPIIEILGEVGDITRGGGSNVIDNGGLQGGSPSNP